MKIQLLASRHVEPCVRGSQVKGEHKWLRSLRVTSATYNYPVKSLCTRLCTEFLYTLRPPIYRHVDGPLHGGADHDIIHTSIQIPAQPKWTGSDSPSNLWRWWTRWACDWTRESVNGKNGLFSQTNQTIMNIIITIITIIIINIIYYYYYYAIYWLSILNH